MLAANRAKVFKSSSNECMHRYQNAYILYSSPFGSISTTIPAVKSPAEMQPAIICDQFFTQAAHAHCCCGHTYCVAEPNSPTHRPVMVILLIPLLRYPPSACSHTCAHLIAMCHTLQFPNALSGLSGRLP